MKYLLKKLGNQFKEKFIPFWVKLLDNLRKVTMLVTFLCMLAGLVYIIYYQFFSKDFYPSKILVSCLFEMTMIHLNLKLQE